MRKEIDRVLGNSLRCILPSYWWKRLLGKMADRIESAEESAASASRIAMLAGTEAANKQPQLVSGSNIKTINNQSILGSGNITINTERMEKYKTKEELDAVGSTDGGEIAAVVDDVLIEKSFAECYQPTSAEINANKYNAKFTKVDGISLNPDFNPNLISSNYGSLRVVLYSDGNSKGYYEDHLSHLDIVCDANRTIFYYEYSSATGIGTEHRLYDSSGFHASAIDIVNNILREGDFRFSYFEVTYRNDVSVDSYTYYYSYNANFPSDATAMIDNVVKMLFAETQNADVYVRSKEWVRLLKEGDVTGGGADITIDSELSDTSENAVQNKVVKAYVDEQIAAIGEGVEFREFYISSDSFANVEGELTEQQKAYNIETAELVKRGKAVVLFGPSGTKLYCCAFGSGAEAGSSSFTFQYAHFYLYSLIVDKDGNVTLEVNYKMWLDSELSETSGNAIQNKVVTSALNSKADKTYVDEKLANIVASSFVVDLTVDEIEDALSNNGGVIDYTLNRELIIDALSKNIPMVVRIGEHSNGYCLAQGELDGADTLTITFNHSQYKYSILIGDESIEVDKRNVESFVTSTQLDSAIAQAITNTLNTEV